MLKIYIFVVQVQVVFQYFIQFFGYVFVIGYVDVVVVIVIKVDGCYIYIFVVGVLSESVYFNIFKVIVVFVFQ